MRNTTSKLSIAGHPLHPALVALPIGLLIWSFVALLIYVGSDENQTWYDIAYYSAIAGVITALVAALPGFVDGYTLARGTVAQPYAIAHALLNLATVAVFAVAALLMYDDGALDGGSLATVVVLMAAGIVMLSISGWLGGEMVFRYRLGVVDDEVLEHASAGQDADAPAFRPDARGPQTRGR
jgi:uncharacterized membrane protein